MLHDLSQVIQPRMFLQSRYAGLKGLYRHTSLRGGGVSISAIDLPLHSATHLDTPNHFFEDGPSVDEIALDACAGMATTIRVAVEPLGTIDRGQLEALVAGSPYVPGDILLISTGWDQYFADDPEAYGAHPFLADDAAEFCVELRIKSLGMDTPTPDAPELLRTDGFIWPVHRILLSAGVLIYENLANLAPLVGQRVRFIGLPIAARGADGAFVRAVAEL